MLTHGEVCISKYLYCLSLAIRLGLMGLVYCATFFSVVGINLLIFLKGVLIY